MRESNANGVAPTSVDLYDRMALREEAAGAPKLAANNRRTKRRFVQNFRKKWALTRRKLDQPQTVSAEVLAVRV